jgi:hypothetical protein
VMTIYALTRFSAVTIPHQFNFYQLVATPMYICIDPLDRVKNFTLKAPALRGASIADRALREINDRLRGTLPGSNRISFSHICVNGTVVHNSGSPSTSEHTLA